MREKEKEIKKVKIYLEFTNHLVCKKLERARRKLIPIQPIIEKLLSIADLAYFEQEM